MRGVSRQYPLINVDLVYLDPNERFHCTSEVTRACIAGFVFQGNTVYSSLRGQEGDFLTPCNGGLFEISTEDHLHPMDVTAGDGGASWLCVSYKVEGQYEVQHVNVAGDYTLPAGWGFAVAQGEVTADEKTATQGLYFAPRTTDIVVSGDADLLLLR
jgi:hypothetical protein